MNDSVKLSLIAVTGPTASGKSELALKLALRFGGEIVCCDSMQIYRGMDIGTAKPTLEERAAVPHHMVDFADPLSKYSVADYAGDAAECVRDICSRGKLPVICGGTGLYLEALLFERPWSESGGETSIRRELSETASLPGGRHVLWERLKEIDPETAFSVHENNVRRVIRAIELYETTGIPKSELDRRSGTPRFRSLVMVLHRADRCEQNMRIERRVDRMFEQGLAEEAESLFEKGALAPGSTASQAIGYKELLGYIRDGKDPRLARDAVVTATRQYAKRQDTWFSKKDYVHKIEIGPEAPDPYPEAEALTAEFLKSAGT